MLWDRWKRNAIDRQVKTAHGAERYLRSGRQIYLDSKCTLQFPLDVQSENATIHKIVVAHGAKKACELASDQNVNGSLAISYADADISGGTPFHIWIDRQKPIHIFDSYNLPMVLQQLDTVTDFASYLDEKLKAVARFRLLSYCGEEDLLAHYLLNFNAVSQRHFIGSTKVNVQAVHIGEGEWYEFSKSDVYQHTIKENQKSYFWDELIQRTCQNALDRKLGGNPDLLRGESAIFEMVKEPRFMRKWLAQRIKTAVVNFPGHPDQFIRQVTFFPSFWPDVGYVLFQLHVFSEERADFEYFEKRRMMLEIACGAAKNKFSHLNKVVGIGMDAPKFAGYTNSEDFILMPCSDWSNEQREFYEEQNKLLQFFGTKQMKRHQGHLAEFVQPIGKEAPSAATPKVGRNDSCPCGSGLKSKKCHGV